MSVDRSKIVVLESDVRALKELQNKLSAFCNVLGFSQPDRALAAAQSERDAKLIIVSTAKGADSLGLLEAVRRENPVLLRILLTGFEDLTLVVEGLHSGVVQRVLSKPLQDSELVCMIRGFAPAHPTASHRAP